MRRGESRIPPSLYLGRGLVEGPEAALALSLRPQTDLLWRSLIQANPMITLSRPFSPGNMQKGEGVGLGVRLSLFPSSFLPSVIFFHAPKR